MADLGVLSYGISITTLEEVFLHINKELGTEWEAQDTAKQVEIDEPDQVKVVDSDPYSEDFLKTSNSSLLEKANLNKTSVLSSQSGKAKFSRITTDENLTSSEVQVTERLVGSSTFGENLLVLFQKRMKIYRRDLPGLLCEVFVPFLMVLIGSAMT